MLFSPTPTTVTNIAVEEQETPPVNTDETSENTPNTEIAQTLDVSTDKKNALNPENRQQTTPVTSQTKSTPEPATSPTPAPEKKPVNVAPIQTKTGQGKYLLVVASLSTQSAAEKYVRKLQAEGFDCEIVDAGNQRFRVSVASFDSLDEATRQANQMKSRPYCEEVWVIRR